MDPEVNLTAREKQIAEIIAWGASYKEVPDWLKKLYGGKMISVNTVKNTMANIFAKIHINKASELSAWWFTHFCGVDSSSSPFKRNLYSCILLLILLPQTFMDIDQEQPIARRSKTESTVRASRRGRRDDEIDFNNGYLI